MTEKTPTKYFDLLLDDSKTEAEILALTNSENHIMVPSDLKGAFYVIDEDATFIKVVKNNTTATADPTTGDDSADGYHVGSRWYNTNTEVWWRCYDNTAAAADWRIVGDVKLYATTSGSTAATFTAYLAFPDASYLTINETEILSFKFRLDAQSQVTNATYGTWVGEIEYTRPTGGSTTPYGYCTQVKVLSGSPITLIDPTFGGSSGNLQMQVSHSSSSATSTEIDWIATLSQVTRKSGALSS